VSDYLRYASETHGLTIPKPAAREPAAVFTPSARMPGVWRDDVWPLTH
jgi:hypothetical protein